MCKDTWLKVKQMDKQKPICKFRAGQVSAALWENGIYVNGRTVNIFKATVQSRYKDKTGTWKTSQSYGKNEIPQLIYVLSRAYDKIITEESGQSEDSSVEEELVD